MLCIRVLGLMTGVMLGPFTSNCESREPVIAQKPMRVVAHLDTIIDRWAMAGAQMQTAEADINYWAYDNVFETDKRARGKLSFIRSKIIRLDLKPHKPGVALPSKKIGKNGRPYTVEAEMPVTWIVEPLQVLFVDHDRRTVEQICYTSETPLDLDHCYLPTYFLNFRPDDLRRKFEIALVDDKEDRVRLRLTPLHKGWASQYSQLQVTLDRKSYQPTELKTFNLSGGIETVYALQNWRARSGQDDPARFNSDPLPGYTRSLHNGVPDKYAPNGAAIVLGIFVGGVISLLGGW